MRSMMEVPPPRARDASRKLTMLSYCEGSFALISSEASSGLSAELVERLERELVVRVALAEGGERLVARGVGDAPTCGSCFDFAVTADVGFGGGRDEIDRDIHLVLDAVRCKERSAERKMREPMMPSVTVMMSTVATETAPPRENSSACQLTSLKLHP
jgi:hypothetical protein